MLASSRIKDPARVAGNEENELSRLRVVTSITEHYCRQISRREYQGMEREVPPTDRGLQVAHTARPLR